MFFCPHLFQPLDPEAPRTGGPGYCSGRTWSIFISSGSTHLRTAVGSLCGSQRSSYTSGTSGSPEVGLKGGNVKMKRGGCPPQAWGSAPPAPSPSVSDSHAEATT